MNDITLSSLVRVSPFTGLIVDVDTWATAHEYHRRHHQLHLLTLHGCGIAHGLDVLPTDPPSDTIVIEPGVAIDGLGNVVISPEQQRLGLKSGESRVYVALDYVESLPPVVSTDQQESRGRVVEGFRMRILPHTPDPPALELARLELSGSSALVVTAPSNPSSPGPCEIDSRFRLRLWPRAPKQILVGLLVCGSIQEMDPNHLRGFHCLLRELRGQGLCARLVESSEGEAPSIDLLYVTGNGTTEPSTAIVDRISSQLKQGGWLFVDVCEPGAQLVEGLRAAFGKQEKARSATESAVLGARFVFGAAPPGASPSGEVAWARQAVISTCDYGCAWAGSHGKQILSREQIRSALEFGVNVAVCASGDGLLG